MQREREIACRKRESERELAQVAEREKIAGRERERELAQVAEREREIACRERESE